MTRSEFYLTVDTICQIFDCSMTSGRRTEKRNAAVGGAPNSRHKKGTAIDIVPDDMSPERKKIIMAACWDLGLTVLDEGDHLHVHVDAS